MSKPEDKFKIEFAPGAFDSFDGTQEELDALIKEVQAMFEGKSKEEILANSRELTEEDWEEMDDESREALLRSFAQAYPEVGEQLGIDPKRRLQ